MQRLTTRAQFQAVMAGTTVSRTPHFALHRVALDTNVVSGAAPVVPEAASMAAPAADGVAASSRVSPSASPSAAPSVPAHSSASQHASTHAGSASALPLFCVDDVWVGVLLPKRWARRAVTRNAIRRQIYAVCTEHIAGLPRAAHVVRLRSGFDRKQFISATSAQLKQAVRGELEQLVRRAAA